MTTTLDSRKLCACGGPGDCRCGPVTTSQAVGFSRPNFFAGQLLTDEDLRDAMDYFVQKNRLHNKHFMGEGVVCGLQVEAHPCVDSSHKVIVRQGHAINGIGDDIVVGRDTELNIEKMVRELTARRTAHDCAPQCETQRQLTERTRNLQQGVLQLKIDHSRERDFGRDVTSIERNIRDIEAELTRLGEAAIVQDYSLFVEYSEEYADHTTSYQVDPCQHSECNASRVREGYRFVLRCPKEQKRQSLLSQLDECETITKDFRSLQGTVLHGLSTLEMVQRVVNQYVTLDKGLKSNSNGEQRLLKDSMLKACEDVQLQLLPGLPEHPTPLPSPIPGPTSLPITVLKQREAVRVFHRCITLIFRYLVLDDILDDLTEAEVVKRDRAILHMKKRLPCLKDVDNNESEKRVADEVVSLLESRNELIQRIVDGESHVPEHDFDSRSLFVGELLLSRDIKEVLNRLHAVNGRLLSIASSSGIDLSPEIRALMATVQLQLFNGNGDILNGSQLPDPASSDEPSTDAFKEIMRQARIVGRAVAEIGRICMCNALLPPCPKENDSGVLIAKIRFTNCQVAEICNLCRRMVITGPALRYWFDDFSGILNSLRKSCSPDPDAVRSAKESEFQKLRESIQEWKGNADKPDYLPDIIAGRSDIRGIWDDVHAPAVTEETPNAIDELERTAIVPKKEGFDLLKALTTKQQEQHENGKGFDSRALNIAIATLAARPGTDVRQILSWVDEFGSPSEVRKKANQASEDARVAKDAMGELNTQIEANAKSIENETESGGGRDSAIKTAVAGLNTLIEANAKSIENETESDGGRDTAIKTAVAGLNTQIEANAKSIENETESDGGRDTAIKTAIDLLAIDHDGDGSTDDKSIRDILHSLATAIRDSLNSAEPVTFLQLRTLLGTVVDADPPEDDLTLIAGLAGPANTKLQAAGIETFQQLAEISVSDLDTALSALPAASKRNFENWPLEASFAAIGLLDQLIALKKSLDADGEDTQ